MLCYHCKNEVTFTISSNIYCVFCSKQCFRKHINKIDTTRLHTAFVFVGVIVVAFLPKYCLLNAKAENTNIFNRNLYSRL